MSHNSQEKLCKKCGIVHPLTEVYFSKSKGKKSSKSGWYGTCKACKKKYRDQNRDRRSEKNREWYSLNREKKLEQNRKWYETNKEEVNKQRKTYREENREKYLEQVRSYNRKRRSDPVCRLQENVSRMVYAAIKRGGQTKGGSTFDYLPYTPKQIREHLENQFDDKMSWDNYGSYWHLDHIYPKSLLPYDSMDHPNFYKCWTLENLQPLEASENIIKSNNVVALAGAKKFKEKT